MTPEPEIEEWQRTWSSVDAEEDGTNTITVIAAAARYQRRSRFVLVANIVFAALLLGTSLVIARRAHSREMVLWAVCVWMATLIAGFLAVEGWRKSRIENIEKVADYVVFHRRRAIVDLWKVRTGAGFLVVLVLIASAWFTIDFSMARIGWARFGSALIVLLTISGIWIYVFARMWRRARVILDSTSSDEQREQ